MEQRQITKDDLEQIYNDNSVKSGAKLLKVSVPTYLKLVKDSGIRMKGTNIPKIIVI